MGLWSKVVARIASNEIRFAANRGFDKGFEAGFDKASENPNEVAVEIAERATKFFVGQEIERRWNTFLLGRGIPDVSNLTVFVGGSKNGTLREAPTGQGSLRFPLPQTLNFLEDDVSEIVHEAGYETYLWRRVGCGDLRRSRGLYALDSLSPEEVEQELAQILMRAWIMARPDNWD